MHIQKLPFFILTFGVEYRLYPNDGTQIRFQPNRWYNW